MPTSKILSVRVDMTTLAICYKILDQMGLKVEGLSMGGAIRKIVDGVAQQVIQAGAVEEMEEEEAMEYLESLLIKDSGNTIRPRGLFTVAKAKGNVRKLYNKGEYMPAYSPLEEEQTQEQLEELDARLQPLLHKAEQEVQLNQFMEVLGSGAKEREPGEDDPKPAAATTTKPPWEVPRASAQELLDVSQASPFIKELLEAKDQIGMMAVRVCMLKLPDNSMGSEASERVMRSVAQKFHIWVKDNGIEPPPSIKFKE